MSMAVKVARSSTRGDPGFLGAIGGLVKKGLGVIGSVAPGPVGAVARVLSGGGATRVNRAAAQATAVRSIPGVGLLTAAQTRAPLHIVQARAQRALARAQGTTVDVDLRLGPSGSINIATAGGAPGQMTGAGLACPSGMRPNKSDYFLKDGTFVPKGTRCVKIRRRNPLNPRALDRSVSRVSSFARATKRSIKKTKAAARKLP